MGKALYRRYRSKQLSEIIGQEHITRTLAEAIKQGRISHAYLFTGPRGVGKTSIARILAHEINNLPYTNDSMHMDIIEIDAASNRRIDEIRDLRDKVNISPSSAPYKVYIIDEVHMLTREAFNALLKTLEEPPAHVIFILATTDAHKLPDTIVSRTQRYTFKPVAKEKVAAHLGDIAKQESITISPEALDLLAEHGEGSFRDSISLLDQASSNGKAIDADSIRVLLGIPPTSAINELYALITTQASAAQVMHALAGLYDQGYQATLIAKQLATSLRQAIIDNAAPYEAVQALELLDELLGVPIAYEPERYLEIVLLGRAKLVTLSSPQAITAKAPKVVTKAVETPAKNTVTPPEPQKTQPGTTPASTIKPVGTVGSAILDEVLWPQVLQALKQKYNTLYGVVRMAEPKFIDSNSLELHFVFAFHQKRISEPANRQILGDIIEQLTGQQVAISCFHTKTAKPKPGEPVIAANATDMNAISSIFGGGEVVS